MNLSGAVVLSTFGTVLKLHLKECCMKIILTCVVRIANTELLDQLVATLT